MNKNHSTYMQVGIFIDGIDPQQAKQVEQVIRQLFILLSLITLHWEAIMLLSKSIQHGWEIITTFFLILEAVIFLLINLPKIIRHAPKLAAIAYTMACALKKEN